MKIFTAILIVIAALIVIILVIALFVKKEYTVESEITINKPRQEVFDYIKIIRNQEKYNKWVMTDPNMKKDFKGTDGTVGFIYSWDGSKAGKGEQEIKSIAEGEKIDMELRFIKPFESTANAYMTTDSISEDQTKVKWVMSGASPYPMNIMNLFILNILEEDLVTSLTNLKANLEN